MSADHLLLSPAIPAADCSLRGSPSHRLSVGASTRRGAANLMEENGKAEVADLKRLIKPK